jgi:hypothetical protein
MGCLRVSDAIWHLGQRRLRAWLSLCRYDPCPERHLCTQAYVTPRRPERLEQGIP